LTVVAVRAVMMPQRVEEHVNLATEVRWILQMIQVNWNLFFHGIILDIRHFWPRFDGIWYSVKIHHLATPKKIVNSFNGWKVL
jgi:hypothetical protein